MELNRLKTFLDGQVLQFDGGYLSIDPLEIVRRYKGPADQEIVGFIAAVLALGRADLIRKAVEDILERMGPFPFRFVQDFDPIKDQQLFKGFGYRFYRDRDVGLLISWLHQIVHQFGSLKNLFLDGFDKNDPHVGNAISRFVQTVRKMEPRPFYETTPAKGSGAGHFLTDPSDGGGCKRFNLFLRWMVRKDNIDLGIWPEIPTNKLVIPLDTHIARLGYNLGLTRRKSPDWKMALEITESLKVLDPDDPIKYDFALCTIGKLNPCPDNPDTIRCSSCPIKEFCVHILN